MEIYPLKVKLWVCCETHAKGWIMLHCPSSRFQGKLSHGAPCSSSHSKYNCLWGAGVLFFPCLSLEVAPQFGLKEVHVFWEMSLKWPENWTVLLLQISWNSWCVSTQLIMQCLVVSGARVFWKQWNRKSAPCNPSALAFTFITSYFFHLKENVGQIELHPDAPLYAGGTITIQSTRFKQQQ